MSDSEEDSVNIGRQKSIFSMGRVKQINHLREKWSPKPKSPDRVQVPTDTSSPWRRRSNSGKFLLDNEESRRPSLLRAQSVSGSPSRQSVVTVVDMDRYLAINTWLENNGVNVAHVTTVEANQREKVKDYGLFDDMFTSLEVLEFSLQSELSHLNELDCHTEDVNSKEEKINTLQQSALSPPLFDYLAVIGADMLDVKIRNFWNQRENMFEATVAFAHPPESQFHAESLEHFCFPTGIRSVTMVDRRNESPDESLSLISKEGDFFVLMISGGGVQGQSVQYAMCMKGTITIRGGSDDGKNMLLPVCYCIVARIPLVPFFRAVLQGFLDNLRDEFESRPITGSESLSCIVTDKHAGYIDDILQNLQLIPLPDKGLSVSVDVFPHPNPTLILTRPHKENEADEKVTLLLQWALPSLLSRLSIECLLQILSFLLLEMKLIVVSDEISLLSSATLGLASLLNPLAWAGPLISVLPHTMHEYMEAPVPIICGVDELPRDFECLKGTCILYLMENRIQLHEDDKLELEKLQMPGFSSLSCDLKRFTKQMLGHVAGSFRDNIMPLSTHLVIHRIHRHIEHLINVCARGSEQVRRQDVDELNADELRFVDTFVQTQMYQKYQDDQPTVSMIEQHNSSVSDDQAIPDQVPVKVSSNNTQHEGLKSASSILFQIALAGVCTLPSSNSGDDIVDEVSANTDVDTQSDDIVALSIFDEPESGSIELSSAASSPSARIFSIIKNSPIEKVESPTRIQEVLSPTLSESPSCVERRPDRTFVWPLSQSELDIFWASDDEVNVPESPKRLALQSPTTNTLESPRRSPKDESDISYGEEAKSVGRSEHGSVVNTQRGDTDTTISIFETAFSEAFANGDTLDDSWLFEPLDDPRPIYQQDTDNTEDEVTNIESLVEEQFTSLDIEELAKDFGPEQHQRLKIQDSFHGPDEGETATHLPQNLKLDQRQSTVLTIGISVNSRGAWEGWCEGELFVSEEFKTLIWERRAVAFAALNMQITDITRVELEDMEMRSPNGHQQRRVRFTFSEEAICFQFTTSSHHDEFFVNFQKLIPSQNIQELVKQQETTPSISPTLKSRAPSLNVQEQTDKLSEDTSIEISTVPSSLLHKESEIDHFKRKLQHGILVEKHGRRGKPHAKLFFTNALCSHIMWSKPPSITDIDDHKRHINSDDQYYHRSSLFSQNKGISVDKITAIVTGKQTTVFRRATANKSNDRVCLSILTSTRTLDICAYSLPGFQELYRGFSLLLEEIKQTKDGLD